MPTKQSLEYSQNIIFDSHISYIVLMYTHEILYWKAQMMLQNINVVEIKKNWTKCYYYGRIDIPSEPT
jgi:hypothetical protein